MELVRDAVDGKHKVLIFSQFTSPCFRVLTAEAWKHMKLPCYDADRFSTPKEERHAV